MSKLLLVGNDWEGLERIGAVAEGLGYGVETILESIDAESTLEADTDFRMVIVQEQMPVMNGYEVADSLRGNPDISADVSIILLAREVPSHRKLEGSGVTGVLQTEADLYAMRECIVHHMEQYA